MQKQPLSKWFNVIPQNIESSIPNIFFMYYKDGFKISWLNKPPDDSIIIGNVNWNFIINVYIYVVIKQSWHCHKIMRL